jgi:hypothetical protein
MKSHWFFVIAFIPYLLTAQVSIQRDVMIPKINTFDPMKVPDIWTEQPRHPHHEMPIPTGIDETLRRKLDLAKEQKFKNPRVQLRKNLNAPETPKGILNPVIEAETDGQYLGGEGTPNDNDIAVANDGTFISVRNTRIYVYNDTGGRKQSWSLQFFPINQNKVDTIPPLTRYYDPRVSYDPYTDRFICLYMHGVTDQTSFIVVAFSSPGNPLAPWNVYKIPGRPINDTVWSDYPIISQTKEDLYITVNLLANGSSWEEGFREAVIWQIRKEDGYNGQSLHTNFFNGIKHEGIPLWSICPVKNGPWPDGIDNYFLTVRPTAEKNDTVFLQRVTNTQKSGKAGFELNVLKSPEMYGFPPSALQPDSTLAHKLRTNDARVLTAIRNGNHIQYMQNSRNFKTEQAHILHGHIYEIESSNPSIQSRLFTHPTLEFGYPDMAFASLKNGDPSMIATTVYSSLTDTPGFGVFYQNRFGEYSDYIKIKAGSSLISYAGIPPSEQRWGDYEGIQAKFNEPGVFYAVGSYGRNRQMNPFIARIKIADPMNQQEMQEVRIFPVPSNQGFFDIEWTSPKEETLKAQLIAMNGGYVANGDEGLFDIKIQAGTHLYRVHTRNFAPGLYQLRVQSSEKGIRSFNVSIQ